MSKRFGFDDSKVDYQSTMFYLLYEIGVFGRTAWFLKRKFDSRMSKWFGFDDSKVDCQSTMFYSN